jgi:acyl dehydratase
MGLRTMDTRVVAERAIEDVSVGEEIPPFGVPLTLQRLVMEAAANRDFTPLHHDREDARATGAPDAYANTMFIQAILEAALRSWMGVRGWLAELDIQMVAFNLVGTVVTAHGRVTDVNDDGDGGTVCLDVWLEADRLRTVVGRARVRLPSAGEVVV